MKFQPFFSLQNKLEIMEEEDMVTLKDVKEVNEKIGESLTFEEKLNAIRDYLNEAEDGIDEKDEFGYLVPNLRDLTEMMMECDQYDLDIDPDGDAIFTSRVFKCNRYIPDYILKMHNIRYAKIGGLFIILPCFILPANKVKAASKNRNKVIKNPEEFGLPSNKQANYGTLKAINSACYICLPKFEGFRLFEEWIFTSKHVDYIYAK